MNEQEYRVFDAINYSSLKHMRKSPAHYKWELDKPKEDDAKYHQLRAIHALVLEPFAADDQIAVWDGRKDKRNKDYAAFLELHAGKSILNPTEHAEAKLIAEAYSKNTHLRWLLGLPGTCTETSVVFDLSHIVQELEQAKLACKGRPDLMHYSVEHGLIIADLKTFGSTDSSLICWAARQHGWLIQLALYTFAAEAHFDIDLSSGIPVRWFTVVAESDGPFDSTAIEWDEDTKARASHELSALLKMVADCTISGQWPGRSGLQVGAAYSATKPAPEAE